MAQIGTVTAGMGESGVITVSVVDEQGIERRVLLPHAGIDPREGIPVSLPVDELYQHMPIEFRQRLVQELLAVGLVEPCDFLKSGAVKLIQAAILAVVKNDVLSIISFAKESNHDKCR